MVPVIMHEKPFHTSKRSLWIITGLMQLIVTAFGNKVKALGKL